MDFNKFLKALFGDKSSKDMKLIQPLVEKVKNVSPEIEKLSNDDLRAKTKELQGNIQDKVKEQKAKINLLKIKIEDTDIDERAALFAQIDKLEKDVLDLYEEALNEAMPTAFAG